MGLIGYVNDETQRRSKEIAIRKVNGAEAPSILSLLAMDILKVAIGAVILGTGFTGMFPVSGWNSLPIVHCLHRCGLFCWQWAYWCLLYFW